MKIYSQIYVRFMERFKRSASPKNAPRIFLRDLRKDVFVRFKSCRKSYDKYRINGKDDLG